MNYKQAFFHAIELVAFILPALPSSIYVRFSILLVYYLAHSFKLQYIYAKEKKRYIHKGSYDYDNEMSNDIDIQKPTNFET
jgi:Gpi18-like mannosyltransferase